MCGTATCAAPQYLDVACCQLDQEWRVHDLIPVSCRLHRVQAVL